MITALPFIVSSPNSNLKSVTTVTVPLTTVNWETLSGSELAASISGSFDTLQVLHRSFHKEAVERLLPALREVRRRFASGQKVNGCNGVEEFYLSINLKPGTVRQWEFRSREALRLMEPKPGHKAEVTVEQCVERIERILESNQLSKAIQTFSALTHASPSAIVEFKKERKALAKLLRDKAREFNFCANEIASESMPIQEEEEEVLGDSALDDIPYTRADLEADLAKRRARREKDPHGTRRWEQEQAQNELALVTTSDDIISTGMKALARKAHPDHGGSTEEMQKINATTAFLRKLVAGSPRHYQAVTQ